MERGREGGRENKRGKGRKDGTTEGKEEGRKGKEGGRKERNEGEGRREGERGKGRKRGREQPSLVLREREWEGRKEGREMEGKGREDEMNDKGVSAYVRGLSFTVNLKIRAKVRECQEEARGGERERSAYCVTLSVASRAAPGNFNARVSSNQDK